MNKIPWPEVPHEVQEYVKRRERDEGLKAGSTIIADEEDSGRWYFVRKPWGWECTGRDEEADPTPADDLTEEQEAERREDPLDRLLDRAMKVKEKVVPGENKFDFSYAKESVQGSEPECDKTIEICKEKFNNVENFGGFDSEPRDLIEDIREAKRQIEEATPGRGDPRYPGVISREVARRIAGTPVDTGRIRKAWVDGRRIIIENFLDVEVSVDSYLERSLGGLPTRAVRTGTGTVRTTITQEEAVRIGLRPEHIGCPVRVVQRHKMMDGSAPDMVITHDFHLTDVRIIPDQQYVELYGPLIQSRSIQ